MNTTRICTVIVHLPGGTVPYVESDGHLNVLIVDHDIEGVEETALGTLPDGSKVTIRHETLADVDPKSVQRWLDLAA